MAKELVAKNEYGLFADKNGTVLINSLDVAACFSKAHRTVLRDIENILLNQTEFGKHNFVLSYYKSKQDKKCKCFDMTRDGFTFLVMGYTGEKADKFKDYGENSPEL